MPDLDPNATAESVIDVSSSPESTRAPRWMRACAAAISAMAIYLTVGTIWPQIAGSPTQSVMREIASNTTGNLDRQSLLRFLWTATIPRGIQIQNDGSDGRMATVTFEALVPHTELTQAFASQERASVDLFERPLKTLLVTDHFRLERTGIGWRVVEQTRNRDPITVSRQSSAWPVTEGSQPLSSLLGQMLRMFYSIATQLVLIMSCFIGALCVFGEGKKSAISSMVIGAAVTAQPILLAFAMGFI